MRLYEDIIRERSAKGPDYMNALLEVERKRDYRVREETLRRDIELLQARIAGIRRDFYPITEEVSQSVSQSVSSVVIHISRLRLLESMLSWRL